MVLIYKNSGFTIVEIMIAIVIASLISFSLYKMVQQASGTVFRVTNIVDSDLPLIPFYNQLELDISGMFCPQTTALAYLQLFNKDKSTVKEDKPLENKAGELPQQVVDQNEVKKEGDNAQIKDGQDDNKDKKEYIKNVFYVKAEDSGDLVFSFITTAGVKTLDTEGYLKPSSFIYRVAYILQKDPKIPETFRIIYKFDSDSQLLDLQKVLDPKFEPAYELISGIKDLKISFTVYEVKEVNQTDKNSKEDKDSQEQKESAQNIIISSWNEEENFKKYKALIPAYLYLSGTYLDTNSKNKIEHKFDFEFKIPAYSVYV